MADRPNNPFDPLNLMQHFDPMKMTEEFNKALGQFAMPGADFGHMLENQRKNMEALAEANRLIMESTQAVMQRQAELLQQTTTEATQAVTQIAGADPAALPAKQAELLDHAYSRAMDNLHEVSETLHKAHQEALRTLEQRWRDMMDDFQALSKSE